MYWTCEAWHILIPTNVPSITLPLPFIIQKRGDHSGTWHVALCPCPPLPPANFPGLGNVSSTPPPAILPGCWLLACRPVGDGVAEDIGLVSLISRVQQQPSGIVITWYLASYSTHYNLQEQCIHVCPPLCYVGCFQLLSVKMCMSVCEHKCVCVGV